MCNYEKYKEYPKKRVLLGNLAIFQKEPNHQFYTFEDLFCECCGKEKQHGYSYLQIKPDQDMDYQIVSCFDCYFTILLDYFFVDPSVEFVLMRGLQQTGSVKPNVKKIREPIGLSLRFDVLKRDGFQCVLCGNSGKESRIEIDHIKPVCEGGDSSFKNLQTLCFDCNRGKSGKYNE